ncbi:MAG: hypothetical protein MI975_05225 [Cytophagales bacterium]|nr:hypothetical protein [Cytophagales bacterium]
MGFKIIYKTLFKVDIHHSYFLDLGNTTFLSMNEEERQKRLQNYNHENFLTIVPTRATRIRLRNHNLVFRADSKNIRVLCKVRERNGKYTSEIVLDEDLKLNFLMYSNDYLFGNYTLLPGEDYRLYLFSNVKPDAVPNPFAYIPPGASGTLIDENFKLSEETTHTVWYELVRENIRFDVNGNFKLIAEIDREDLLTDEGKQIVKQSINEEQGKGLLGIVQLQMSGDQNLDLIETDNTDPNDIKSNLLDPFPAFKLHFRNRKTIWKYIKKSEQKELETSSELPLTRDGFIEIDPGSDITGPLPTDIGKYVFPNPTAESIKRITDESTNTTTIYSEIYI